MLPSMTALKRTPEKETAFLAALAETCNVTRACKAVGVNRNTAYDWRDRDPEFAKRWDRARAIGADALEDEAMRRAKEGLLEPVFHQGRAIGTIRKYSDTLTIFLLKGAKPEKYAERSKVEASGSMTVIVDTGVPVLPQPAPPDTDLDLDRYA